ncbi:CoA-binding protein [Aliiruegeria sabulilitoris]|uniref:CoA-binding protein n=1 Tax=Aliiruegeria sabulilitoris TaxID=1510458 RepID=UPI00082C9033|nr:CoA-binding protein [Aliiruegeria sabulilitoris]NDR56597.1 CoA-binding protein [Pseudoruegeria sp. M32A2M]
MNAIDQQIREIFERSRVIACVGASANPARPSYYVSIFLKQRGYRVIPVNPGLAGQELFGETVVGSLSEVEAEVDMIDIFRRSEQVSPIVAQALIHLPRLRTVWMQIGVANADAAMMAGERGVDVIENRCPKIEIPRLFGPDWRVG